MHATWETTPSACYAKNIDSNQIYWPGSTQLMWVLLTELQATNCMPLALGD